MIKTVKVEDAVGMAIAHDLTRIVPGEFKGAAFKKGHIIREEDVKQLKDMGKYNIYVLRLEEVNSFNKSPQTTDIERLCKQRTGRQMCRPVSGGC